MGYRRSYNLPALQIASGQTASAAIAADPHYRNASAIVISCEESALTGTVTVAVSLDGTNYRTLQSGGADVAIAADQSIIITELGFTHFRLESSASEGAARDFLVRAIEEIGR